MSKRYPLILTDSDYDALVELAKKEGRTVADLFRFAIKKYAASQGIKLSMEVEHGGLRPNNPLHQKAIAKKKKQGE